MSSVPMVPQRQRNGNFSRLRCDALPHRYRDNAVGSPMHETDARRRAVEHQHAAGTREREPDLPEGLPRVCGRSSALLFGEVSDSCAESCPLARRSGERERARAREERERERERSLIVRHDGHARDPLRAGWLEPGQGRA